MEKSKLIWMNGEFVNWEDATVSVMSHTLHYGTGVFEGIRARECPKGTSIFRLNDHVDRLYNSAKAYNMNIPYDKEVITQAIKDSVHLNNLTSAYIRPLVFLSLIHISEPTRLLSISYAVFCLKKKNNNKVGV